MAVDPLASLAGAISTAALQNMGIETVLLAVQSNKALILEELLKDQMLTLQKKNDSVAGYNTLMAYLNGLLARFNKDATPTTLVPNATQEDKTAMKAALAAAGTTYEGVFGNVPNFIGVDLNPVDNLAKSYIDTAVTKIKSMIDNLSNTQQLDMLRVQSISNKRNEAFELMTTFIKKFNDMVSAIIRNMG